MSGGAGGPRGGGEAESGALEEGLRWLAGHCRFVTTELPRGETGVSFAAELLAALPDACRRRVPDLTGTGPELFASAVDYGILRDVPSPRVMRAVPRLIAARSPLVELRGKRQWTLWIVHALDPAMLMRIRRRTPASQLDVCVPASGPGRGAPRRKRRDLAAEVESLGAALAAEREARAMSQAREEASERALSEKSAALALALLDSAELGRRQSELQRLRQTHVELVAAHREAVAEAGRLREKLVSAGLEQRRVAGELDVARASVRELEERIRSLAKAPEEPKEPKDPEEVDIMTLFRFGKR